MTTTTARDYWIRRFEFGSNVRCVLRRSCETHASFQIGWRFDKRVAGKLTETVATRSACERDARLFAFKHDLKIPRARP